MSIAQKYSILDDLEGTILIISENRRHFWHWCIWGKNSNWFPNTNKLIWFWPFVRKTNMIKALTTSFEVLTYIENKGYPKERLQVPSSAASTSVCCYYYFLDRPNLNLCDAQFWLNLPKCLFETHYFHYSCGHY